MEQMVRALSQRIADEEEAKSFASLRADKGVYDLMRWPAAR